MAREPNSLVNYGDVSGFARMRFEYELAVNGDV
jgi:hypothetical protein